jgi:hypothetical protein
VIDPSLFPGPVSKTTWAGVQGDPAAILEPSSASVYFRRQGGAETDYDPAYTKTNDRTVMPLTACPGGAQLTWKVEVERANATQCTYWITVKNLTPNPVTFEGRFAVLS